MQRLNMITIYNLHNTQMKHSLLKMFRLDGLGWVLNVNVKINILIRKARLHFKYMITNTLQLSIHTSMNTFIDSNLERLRSKTF